MVGLSWPSHRLPSLVTLSQAQRQVTVGPGLSPKGRDALLQRTLHSHLPLPAADLPRSRLAMASLLLCQEDQSTEDSSLESSKQPGFGFFLLLLNPAWNLHSPSWKGSLSFGLSLPKWKVWRGQASKPHDPGMPAECPSVWRRRREHSRAAGGSGHGWSPSPPQHPGRLHAALFYGVPSLPAV